MIGDTNLYLNDSGEPFTAECEIMIADETARGRKKGWEAMILMFRYGIDSLKIQKYRAKIKLDNAKSIKMFTKLKFHEVNSSMVSFHLFVCNFQNFVKLGQPEFRFSRDNNGERS